MWELYKCAGWCKEIGLENLDIVYFVKDAKENEELRYSLRSVEQNFPHRKVWFCGGKPDGLNPDMWMRITQNAKTKWGNTSGLLRDVCANDEVSENFVLFNDDFYVMQPIERLPYYSDGSLDDRIKELRTRHRNGSAYTTRMQFTKIMLERHGLPTLNYAMHMPMIINRAEMQKTFEQFPDGEMWRSLYGNHHYKPTEHMHDCKVYDVKDWPPTHTPFLSSTDYSFANGYVGRYIRETFWKPCRYEEVEI